jgi:CHAD domain-containing protein
MYHRLRIRCKALRYALEFHGGLYGKAAQRMVDNLVELQDLLGEHQDAEVAVAWLRELMQRRRRRLAPDTAFVAGKLVERYQRTARRLRARFPRRFDRTTGKVWHRLQQVMSRAAGSRAEGPRRV